MKTAKFFTAILLSLTFVLASCSKYEEGPAISLLTKKMRLTGDWTPVKSITDGVSVEYDNKDRIITFEKDGTYISKLSSASFTGEWDFNDDKTKVVISNSGSIQFNNEKEIIRLTNKELWLIDAGVETHYEKLK
ncbi:hypothetical protein [Brumimicrobium sp.]|uniref:hypothetical protein n=1 Tax=Brumimicrobium sp. TaxID=2029867 RepID=UPI003A92301A